MAARSSSHGAGTGTDTEDGQNLAHEQRLAELRKRHLAVKQVLKAKQAPESASYRSQSGAPTPKNGKRLILSRQATLDSNDSFDAYPRSGSVPERRVSFQANHRDPTAFFLHQQEDAWNLFTEDMRAFETTVSAQRGRIDDLRKSHEDAPAQTADLLQAAGALEQLNLPETEALLQAARGSVDTFNVKDKKRSQDVQLAIDGLWDALRTQGRQIQGVRGLSAGIAALEKGIEAQAGQIGALQHAVQEIYNALYWAWEAMEAQEAVFDDVAAQLQEHHREELQRIEFGLAIRERATDTLQVELDSLRRREAAKRGETCGESSGSLSRVPSDRSSLSSVAKVLERDASASEAAGLGVDYPEESEGSFD